MKTKLGILFVLLTAGMLRAQSTNMTGLLQQGLFEEQANRNLDAAIGDYKAVAGQFDKDRQMAATAIFRLGECYRAQGKTNEAASQYERIVREFADQQTLATLSRQNLAGLGVASGNPISSPAPTDEEDREIERYRTMLQNSPDLLNAASSLGTPPLVNAAGKGELRVAEFLLEHGGDVNVNYYDCSPLSVAADHGQKAMVELLLAHGADINCINDLPLRNAAGKGFQAVVQTLLAHHANVNGSGRDFPLGSAIKSGQSAMVKMILDAGADPSHTNMSGESALVLAIGRRSPEIAKVLLAAGANPNVGKLTDGESILSYAIDMDMPELVPMLLEAKADVNAGPANLLPLSCAVNRRRFSTVELLLKAKADPNKATLQGISILFPTVDQPDILEALLDAGAEVDPRSKGAPEDWTPLGSAARGNLVKPAEILLKHGANPNVTNYNGTTPLHWAAYNESPSPEMFSLLLSYKANPNVRSSNGNTPLAEVKNKLFNNNLSPQARANIEKVIDILHKHGARDKLPDWNNIEVGHPGGGQTFTVFEKGAHDWNHFTLLETILNFYESGQTYWIHRDSGNIGVEGTGVLPFPDLAHLTIVRPVVGLTNDTRIQADILNGTNGIDCSRDVPLDFGDLVEIAELDHSLDERPIGLTDGQANDLIQCLTGHAQLIVHNQKVELTVNPIGGNSVLESLLHLPEAQKILLASSDLSRTKVIRHDPKTGKSQEWTVDCSDHATIQTMNGYGAFPRYALAPRNTDFMSGFRVRNGDVIEVPEKSQ